MCQKACNDCKCKECWNGMISGGEKIIINGYWENRYGYREYVPGQIVKGPRACDNCSGSGRSKSARSINPNCEKCDQHANKQSKILGLATGLFGGIVCLANGFPLLLSLGVGLFVGFVTRHIINSKRTKLEKTLNGETN